MRRLSFGRDRFALSTLALALLIAASPTTAAAEGHTDKGPFANLKYRAIGPVNMSGRVADVEGIPGNPNGALGSITACMLARSRVVRSAVGPLPPPVQEA